MGKIKLPQLQDMKAQRDAQKRFGDKKVVVITGTSSGLGRAATKALLGTGEYHVIGAVRDLDKMEIIAEMEGFDSSNFTPMECDLQSFSSVRNFVEGLKEYLSGRKLDRLVCNAAVYQPTLDYAKWTPDGFEQQLQTNYLSHFLMISLLLDTMRGAQDPRCIMIGSVTGNDNTVGGGGVWPRADLKNLEGLRLGGKRPLSMIDGYNFNGAKAYKDTKLALMMLANTLHSKYNKATGISFSSMYPGCIAASPLFREKRPWFRKYFPVFMKYITGGFVGEDEAGQRLMQAVHDPKCSKSGVYWGWNGGARVGRGMESLEKDGQIIGAGGAGGGWDSVFENEQSDKVLDIEKAVELFKLSTQVTGAEWPDPKGYKSPCPTLRLVDLMTAVVEQKEEMERMKNPPRPVGEEAEREEQTEDKEEETAAPEPVSPRREQPVPSEPVRRRKPSFSPPPLNLPFPLPPVRVPAFG